MKTIILKIDKKDIHQLISTSMKNFLKEDPTRFELLKGKKTKSGTMHFCENYLTALIVFQTTKASAIYFDLCIDEYVVCTKQRFN